MDENEKLLWAGHGLRGTKECCNKDEDGVFERTDCRK